jgi:indolepyruvate decarboxylase
VTSEQLRIRHHHYPNVDFASFLRELNARQLPKATREIPASLHPTAEKFELRPQVQITITRLFARLNEQLTEDTIVIADIGDSLFGASELNIRGRTEFLSPAYYTSMGFSVPAALGANVARPDHRVVVICGDGAFQMTGMELSNMVRKGYNPVIIVLDNHGYGTERILHPGKWEYNEIHPWKYAQLPAVLGGGTGYEVRTEAEFDAALSKAWADDSGFSLIQVHITDDDSSEPLKRLAERLGKRIG